MRYEIKVNGYLYTGRNCQGLGVFNSVGGKQFSDRSEADRVAATIGGIVSVVPLWRWDV